jgi:hypothetical protein
MRFSLTLTVVINSGASVITWTTYDANGNGLATGTAATLAAAGTAAIASLKASVSAEVTLLGAIS